MKHTICSFILLVTLLGGPQTALSQAPATTFSGEWAINEERSTAIDPWRDLTLRITATEEWVDLTRAWRGTREGGAFDDSLRLQIGEAVQSPPMIQWPDNRHAGVYIAGDRTKTVFSEWKDDGHTLTTEATLEVSVQQGLRTVRIYTEYRLSPGGDRLDVLELRSTRPRPIHYVFFRSSDSSE